MKMLCDFWRLMLQYKTLFFQHWVIASPALQLLFLNFEFSVQSLKLSFFSISYFNFSLILTNPKKRVSIKSLKYIFAKLKLQVLVILWKKTARFSLKKWRNLLFFLSKKLFWNFHTQFNFTFPTKSFYQTSSFQKYPRK